MEISCFSLGVISKLQAAIEQEGGGRGGEGGGEGGGGRGEGGRGGGRGEVLFDFIKGIHGFSGRTAQI